MILSVAIQEWDMGDNHDTYMNTSVGGSDGGGIRGTMA